MYVCACVRAWRVPASRRCEARGGAAISTASSRALRFPPVTRTVSATYFQCDRREVVMK